MTDLVDADSGHSTTARLEAFSDGVFAIAITLLILEVKVPHAGTGEGLVAALLRLWPSYLGYAISFVTLGIMWTNHHAMFTYIRRCDSYGASRSSRFPRQFSRSTFRNPTHGAPPSRSTAPRSW